MKERLPSEKELADTFTDGLAKIGVEDWIHIPNRVFINYKNDRLKSLPDYIFPFRGFIHMVELGVPGVHTDRKRDQLAVMQRWAMSGNVKIHILSSIKAIMDYFVYLTTWRKGGENTGKMPANT